MIIIYGRIRVEIIGRQVKLEKYKGIMLVSDMDATLLNTNHKVSDGNYNAIHEFTREGGIFTVASGRMLDAVRVYLDRVGITAPAILHNGAKVYDFKKEETIYEKNIEAERKLAIRRVYDTQPQFGIEVYSREKIYVMRECMETARLLKTPYEVTYSMPDSVWDEPWTKALIIGEEADLDVFEPVFKTEYDTGYSVRSGKYYLDMVANGVSKGFGVETIAKMYGIDRESIYCVGDNMNDYEMVEFAGHGFAVANGVDKLKKIAEAVVPDCDSNAVAYIINHYIKKGR